MKGVITLENITKYLRAEGHPVTFGACPTPEADGFIMYDTGRLSVRIAVYVGPVLYTTRNSWFPIASKE